MLLLTPFLLQAVFPTAVGCVQNQAGSGDVMDVDDGIYYRLHTSISTLPNKVF